MSTRGCRTSLRRRAAALLDQQLWCWGRDVARPEGNVLLGLGMCRYRAGGGRGGSAYTGRVTGGGVVWLWGFGLLFGLPHRGAVFLRRYGFDPVLVPEPRTPVHAPAHLGPMARPTTARQRVVVGELVRAAAEWVAGYEHWVAESFGPGYREAALAARGKPPAVPAKNAARAWEHLAKKSVRLVGEPAATPRGPWGRLITALGAPLARGTTRNAPPRRATA